MVLLMLACGGRKHDVAYYQQKIDSIRKAEQVAELQKNAGIINDPVEAWFDTLRMRSLPLQTAGANVERLGPFASVPMQANEHFGFPVSAHLKALALPRAWKRPVILLCEMQDSITPALYLYTMDSRHQPIDLLCIYRQQSEDHKEDFGMAYNEYFITSKYEITVLRYFQSHEKSRQPFLEEVRRFTITKEGRFDEQPIEVE